MLRKYTASSGFTLIELLVVITILGILSTVVLIAINPAQRIAESRDSQRRADLSQLREAIEAYAVAHNGQYPVTNAWRCDDCGLYDTGGTQWNETNWIPGLVDQGYLKKLPKDPQNGQQAAGVCGAGSGYGYLYYSNGVNYKLLAHCSVRTGLNRGAPSQPATAYCSPRPPYDETSFNPAPTQATKLKPMVDPVRYTYSYAVYSPGFTCL